MPLSEIQLHDKRFKPYLDSAQIVVAVQRVAEEINRDYAGKQPVFLSILNGSFMFSADLLKHISVPCEISFVKLASYHGTQSTGKVRTLLGLDVALDGRSVIIVEDIVDTGKTMHEFLPVLKANGATDVAIASLLVKPEALQHKDVNVRYKGFEIPNDFIVGYGLDYDGLGRNLPDIYVIS
jgi:hypoxanthine phosphoribosyltransferase